jgi:hypothetical protein
VWVLTFFVMGVVIGLLLLVLQGGQPPSWLTVSWPHFAREDVPPSPAVVMQREPVRGSEASRHTNRLDHKVTNGAAAPLPEEPGRVIVAPMQCNREAAQAVRNKASELATLGLQGGIVQIYLGRAWEYYTPGHRRSFVEAFAEADHCLQGEWRPMRFSFRGAVVATVSVEGAIDMH